MDNSKNISDSASSELMSEKARKLTDDIQLIMAKFYVACKDGRTTDVSVLMENVLQLLQELKDEFSKSSQTSPLQVLAFCILFYLLHASAIHLLLASCLHLLVQCKDSYI